MAINIYNLNSSNNTSLQTRNALFLCFQLFIEVLLGIANKQNNETTNAKQDLIRICKENYQGNENGLKNIDEFNKTYVS
jgi:hypothetical protein